MGRLSCFAVLLRTSMVLHLFLKSSQAQYTPCTNNTVQVTSTSINVFCNCTVSTSNQPAVSNSTASTSSQPAVSNSTVSTGNQSAESNCNVSTGSQLALSNSTVAILSGLSPGGTYSLNVQCSNTNCSMNVTTKPDTVTNLTVTEFTTSSVALTWSETNGSSFYTVQWTGGGDSDNLRITIASLNVTGLRAGVKYIFTVTAVAGDNTTGGQSNAVIKYTKPATIKNINVAGFTMSSVSLSWTQPEGDRSFYKVDWTGGSVNHSMNTTSTSANITGLTAGLQYTFTVTAVAGDNATVGDSSEITKFTRPDVIRNLTITEIRSYSVSLNWTEPLGNSSFYIVEWTDGSVNHSMNTTSTSANITGLTAGLQYTFTVTAVAGDNATVGDSSEITKFTKPATIKNINVAGFTMSSVSLSWTQPEGDRSFYKVDWTGGSVNHSMNTTSTSANITGLTAGLQYTFTVTAVAGDNATVGDSSEITTFTRPDVIRNLTITEIRSYSVSLNWTEPLGNSSFYIVEWTDGSFNHSMNTTSTSANITGLTAGLQYTFTVTAVAGDNATVGDSSEITTFTRPDVIRNLTITEIRSYSVSLNWTEPLGNSSFYIVEWTDGSVNHSMNTTSTSANITGLTAGLQYTFTVTAVAGDNATVGDSSEITKFTRPDVIRNLTITEIRSYSVSLNWTEPLGNSSFYIVEWTDGSINENTTTLETHVNVTELTAGMKYTFRIIAVAGDNTTNGYASEKAVYSKPATIKNLNVAGFTMSSVSLSWTQPEGDSSFYKVDWTGGSVNHSMNTTSTSANITGLTAGLQYTFTVTAVAGDNATVGDSSEITTFTRPDVIRNLTITEIRSYSVSLNWTEPLGNSSFYIVEWTDGSFNHSMNTTSTSANITGLTAGLQYTFTVTAVAGDNATVGDSSEITKFTKPSVVSNLSVVATTTSSASLSWSPPTGNFSFYKVNWDGFSNQTSTTNFTVSSLSGGRCLNFTVTAVAGDNTTVGDGNTVNACTYPTQPGNIMAATQGTTQLNVSWTLPGGRVDYYNVRISNATWNNTNGQINQTWAIFTLLLPGRVYGATVTAVAGSLSNQSAKAQLATVPTPPGPLNITERTTSSISIQWTTPDQMTNATNISYNIIYQSDASVVGNLSSSTPSYNLTSLVSGSNYNIRVTTIGPQNLGSEPVNTSACTLAKPVLNLTAKPLSSWSVFLKWDAPADNQSYRIQYKTAAVLVQNNTVSTTFNVCGLQPGTGYNFTVTTLAASGCEANPVPCFSYTMPKAVGNLTVVYSNTTAVSLSWSQQDDWKPTYSYLVATSNNGPQWNDSTPFSNYTFTSLQPGYNYNFTVAVVNHGVQSETVWILNYTAPSVATNISAIGTTTTMNVSWDAAVGQVDSYTVTIYNGSPRANQTVYPSTTAVFLNLTPGTLYVVKVDTNSGPLTVSAQNISSATYPNPPGAINVQSQNINTINISWSSPIGMDQVQYNFSVYILGRQNLTGSSWFLLDNLQCGTLYNVSVVTVGVLNYLSAAVTKQIYTMPESVNPLISNNGNSSITVNWTAPCGNVDQYVVNLSDNNTYSNTATLISSWLSYTFQNLSAGRLYTAMVTTVSGPFNTTSIPVTTATYPNQPGGMEILGITTTSISVKWAEAPLMANTTFFYKVNYQCTQQITQTNTTNTSLILTNLFSGTSYNISVVTVGVLGFQSKEVRMNLVTTRPERVRSLTAQAGEHYVTLTWDWPVEYKPSYVFIVNGTNFTNCTGFNSTTISDLDPGRPYNFSVTTQTVDGTQGDSVWFPFCTVASSVSNLMCNTTDAPSPAHLNLSWSQPQGWNRGFQISATETNLPSQGPVQNPNVSESCNPTCGYQILNLKYYTNYTLSITTLGCGKSSTVQIYTCLTGISAPPAPSNIESLVAILNRTTTSFTIQLKSNILNDTNGMVKQFGVLVTSDIKSFNLSKSGQYLMNTYNKWIVDSTLTYLATVRDTSSLRSTGSFDVIIGDETLWNSYLNGQLKASSVYSFAIVLFTKTDPENVPSSIYSVTLPFSDQVSLSQNNEITGLAIGVGLGIFTVLLLIVAGIFYIRRHTKKETSDIQIQSMRAKVNIAVRVEDYEAYYKKQRADSNCGFAEEFEDLKPVGTAQARASAVALENKPKNRYNNVLPYDSSRVKLSIQGSPFDDYINSNYIPGYNSRKEFIAAQGPLPCTVNEFWRMIWEKNVQTLVMLTRCNEQGRVKCEKYWPSETKCFGNITVATTSDIPLEDWTIRDFEIKNIKTAETRSVRHFHFTAWPDHGVPETTELLINFRHLVREHMDQYSRHSPTVVHCSAGVGRTGTFIAIDRLIFQIERESMVDVYGIIHDLRMHRPLMVQTEDQYVFLNQCAMDIIRSRTGTNVDLIYQNTAALGIYENVEPKNKRMKNGYHDA
ncbi:receptor-type tyrosine-protein phosphatase eta isoform X3 [Esox lucius]|uniref:receptor-type tyrosine-protein phosphatase eta isoform X3 n=1 Tax=Esox lucius TaxID=8010 RepID=UPI001476D7F6|nr:receptor-type tyrosine-protein phosphatase eta isoform X3 [Esox lucius]